MLYIDEHYNRKCIVFSDLMNEWFIIVIQIATTYINALIINMKRPYNMNDACSVSTYSILVYIYIGINGFWWRHPKLLLFERF